MNATSRAQWLGHTEPARGQGIPGQVLQHRHEEAGGPPDGRTRRRHAQVSRSFVVTTTVVVVVVVTIITSIQIAPQLSLGLLTLNISPAVWCVRYLLMTMQRGLRVTFGRQEMNDPRRQLELLQSLLKVPVAHGAR